MFYNNLVPYPAPAPAPLSSPAMFPASSSPAVFSSSSHLSSAPPSAPPPRKVARVQPTPHIVRPIAKKPAPATPSPSAPITPSPKHSPAFPSPAKTEPAPLAQDPMAALTSMVAPPAAVQRRHLSPKREVKQEVISLNSRSPSPWGDHSYCSSPEPEPPASARSSLQGVAVTTKAARSTSIQLVLQQSSDTASYNIKQVTVKDGSKAKASVSAKEATKAMRIKAKHGRVKKFKGDAFVVPLSQQGGVYPSQKTFVNEQTVGGEEREDEASVSRKYDRMMKGEPELPRDAKQPTVLYTLRSDDGAVNLEGANITHLWRAVFEAVSAARGALQLPGGGASLGPSGEDMLGLTHSALRYLLEQAPAATACSRYTWQHHPPPHPAQPELRSGLGESHHYNMHTADRYCFFVICASIFIVTVCCCRENPSGSARTEPWSGTRRPHDMFAWLASRYCTVLYCAILY